MRKRLPIILALLALSACQKKDLKTALFSDDSDTRQSAVGRLAGLDEASKKTLLPFLIQSLNSPAPLMVDRAQDALTNMGAAAIPDLSQAFLSADPFIRLSVTEIAGQMGDKVPGALDILAKSLKDPHPLIREEAARSLSHLTKKPA